MWGRNIKSQHICLRTYRCIVVPDGDRVRLRDRGALNSCREQCQTSYLKPDQSA